MNYREAVLKLADGDRDYVRGIREQLKSEGKPYHIEALFMNLSLRGYNRESKRKSRRRKERR